ncbi:MAG TPA: type II 3-dehydroquinate dehydratase [Gemmatimonadales bacterium]|jgi:3-dehydroquinate dehydratase II|nr:type II 3-dehydroquinate dehydratase [Gemmatimonadales bacterium]
MRVAVLNGPNLNLLGTREPELYGRQTLADIEASVRREAARLDVEIEWFQTNHEGDLVEAVQGLRGRVDGAVINPAAYGHSSLALRDAFLAVRIPFVEVHLSNIFAREPVRRHSVLADLAVAVIAGLGGAGYPVALATLVDRLRAG